MRKQIADFIRHLQNEQNVSPHTARSYRSDLEQFAAFADDADPASIGHQDLRRYLGHLIGLNIRKSSLARKLSSIRAFYKYLNRTGVLQTNPARLLATPRQDKRLPAVLTKDEVRSIFSHVKTPHNYAYLATCLLLRLAPSGRPSPGGLRYRWEEKDGPRPPRERG